MIERADMMRCHKINNSYLQFLILFILLLLPSISHAWLGKVVYVVDGDTFDVERDGKNVRVRIYGVVTP
jgi:endonuclease YncB( thermonuclease family)